MLDQIFLKSFIQNLMIFATFKYGNFVEDDARPVAALNKFHKIQQNGYGA